MLPKPTEAFAWVQAAARPALVCEWLVPYASHLFTTRAWSLGNPDTDCDRGWAEVARAMDAHPGSLIRAHQVHGANVIARKKGSIDAVRGHTPAAALPQADILVTDDPDVAVGIQTADCVPLLVADARTGAVGAAHAGWRGLAAGVPRAAVDALARNFGSDPRDLIAAIGPSISAGQYEVDVPVRDAFDSAGFDRARLDAWFRRATREAHWQFDGWAAARDQLEAAGVPAAQIAIAGLCTASHPDILCSYRRDGQRAGRLAGVIRPRRERPPR